MNLATELCMCSRFIVTPFLAIRHKVLSGHVIDFSCTIDCFTARTDQPCCGCGDCCSAFSLLVLNSTVASGGLCRLTPVTPFPSPSSSLPPECFHACRKHTQIVSKAPSISARVCISTAVSEHTAIMEMSKQVSHVLNCTCHYLHTPLWPHL